MVQGTPGPLGRAAPSPLLFLLLGALAGLAQVPTAVPFLMLAVLVVVLRAPGGFRHGLLLGLGHFAVSLRWIVEPFLVEPERHGWMAPFALLLLAGGLALLWAAAFWAARRWRLGPWGLAALLVLVEIGRSHVLTGFPWALVGHAWDATPYVQTVAWWGAHGLSLATLLLAAAVARLGWSPWQGLAPVALALAWVALDPGTAPPAAGPLVRLVQPNVPQAEKWDPALQPGHLARLLALSATPPGGAPPALVVWPETALTQLLDDAGPVLRDAAARARAPLATGVARWDGARYFNALAVTDPQGIPAAVYDKHHLVPFGEYVPLAGPLGLTAFVGTGFTPGPGPALLPTPLGPAAALICYEGIFAEEIPPGARLLLLVTNDAWFGANAGPRQHLALGRLRAIETGLPLLRAANTGISALIDGHGRTLARLPLNTAGALDVHVPDPLAAPPYARWGDWPALVAALGVALAAWRSRGARGPPGPPATGPADGVPATR